MHTNMFLLWGLFVAFQVMTLMAPKSDGRLLGPMKRALLEHHQGRQLGYWNNDRIVCWNCSEDMYHFVLVPTWVYLILGWIILVGSAIFVLVWLYKFVVRKCF